MAWSKFHQERNNLKLDEPKHPEWRERRKRENTNSRVANLEDWGERQNHTHLSNLRRDDDDDDYRVISNEFLLSAYYVPSSAKVYRYWLYKEHTPPWGKCYYPILQMKTWKLKEVGFRVVGKMMDLFWAEWVSGDISSKCTSTLGMETFLKTRQTSSLVKYSSDSTLSHLKEAVFLS